MSNIYVFYHFYACTPNYKLWLDEQLQLVKETGLADVSTVNMIISYKRTDIDEVVDYVQSKYSFVNIIKTVPSTAVNRYEGATLKEIYDFSQNHPNAKILYFHSKCISRPVRNTVLFPDECRHNWRNMMQYFCIEKFKTCIHKLDEYDILGCRWMTRPVPHFSGNFWWANAHYIRDLQDPIEKARFKHKWKRLSCEFWIGGNKYLPDGSIIPGDPKYLTLHQPSIRRMTGRGCEYPRLKYAK
jgi:hypothetical protein